MIAIRSRFLALFLLAPLIACEPQRQGHRAVVTPLRDLSQLGAFSNRGLVEASGLVRSEINAGVYWSQNDSGNDESLFAYDSTGASLGVTRVTDAFNRDWEAIALGPCAIGSCLYIGDVGDNGAPIALVSPAVSKVSAAFHELAAQVRAKVPVA